MSDDRQQNLPPDKKRPPTSGSFKPGFDKRRWLKGRGGKSPEQREGDEILRAVYWKELSRVFDVATGKPIEPEPEGEITALELAVRQQIKKQFDKVAERIAGKVTDKVDVTSGGEKIKGYVGFTPEQWDKKKDNDNT